MIGYIFFITILISGLGIFSIWSINRELIYGHISVLSLGVVLYYITSRFDKETLKNISIPAYIILFAGLAILFTQPAIRGAQRWLIIGNLTIHVAEIGKPLFALAIAGICTYLNLRKLNHIGLALVIGLLPIVMVLKQPDLGDAILYILILFAGLFSGYSKYRYLLILFLIGAILIPVGWQGLADYQKNRIISFATPGYDPKGIGYNATQALIAVGSGKLKGRGLGQGTQSHLRFLPESHTDFIFASLTEELGFIGGSILITAYGLLFYKILIVALKTEDLFTRLLSIGIFIQMFSQTFINIGMNLNIVPITGVTLPLVSYGGSSIVSTYISLGLIEAVRQNQVKKEIVIR